MAERSKSGGAIRLRSPSSWLSFMPAKSTVKLTIKYFLFETCFAQYLWQKSLWLYHLINGRWQQRRRRTRNDNVRNRLVTRALWILSAQDVVWSHGRCTTWWQSIPHMSPTSTTHHRDQYDVPDKAIRGICGARGTGRLLNISRRLEDKIKILMDNFYKPIQRSILRNGIQFIFRGIEWSVGW